jgi:hypothetical protein
VALHNGSRLKIKVTATGFGQQNTTKDSARAGGSIGKEYRSPFGNFGIYWVVCRHLHQK